MTTTPLCVFEKLSKAAFMNEVQKFPVLYDKFNKDFKDKWKKKNAWEEVGRLSNLSPNQAEEKYKSIRSSYGRWLKSKKNIPSGSGRNSVPPQFLQLDWLNTFIEHRETTTSICLPSDSRLETSNLEENIDMVCEQVENTHHPFNNDHISEEVTTENSCINTCVQGESSESTIHANNKKKRKKLDSDDLLDRTLVKTLEKINSNIETPNLEEQDEDYLFMKSLVPQLKRLNNYSKALAKVQIQTLLLKLEFPVRGETI
ncbi:uncharacterized protein LOC124815042 [Hydra vulgaris]|uniref:uncharacterized protein LOC124815042 n=1 Tax=Hydra vulgaris TaxID=6087 RepID=UPI0001924BD3|nr:uncharacterized protein LOC124815042 [Hydra vulgaris]